jgi:hypothetical protein
MSEVEPPDEAAVEAFVADGLLVTECRPVTLASAPDATVPLILVDAAARPDLLDLGRVFVQEQPGGGEVRTRWDLLEDEAGWQASAGERPRGYVSLTVSVSRPVRSALKLLFTLPRWIDELEWIAAASKLAIALGPPDDEGNPPPLQLATLANPGAHAHEVVRDALDLVERWEAEEDSAP